jgi:hypothetical protein
MARERSQSKVDRRKFLTGVAVAGPHFCKDSIAQTASAASGSALSSNLAADAICGAIAARGPRPSCRPSAWAGRPDRISGRRDQALSVEYIANPASSFRGLQIAAQLRQNTQPEFITCMHEESSVGMAHGYFKVTGEAHRCARHGQSACSTPHGDLQCLVRPRGHCHGRQRSRLRHRPPGAPAIHSAQDINALVRDFTKWDDTPVSLEHFAQSVVRAYKIAMTPPHAPVMIALDAELQEETVHDRAKLAIPKLTHTMPPQADLGAVREAAKLLVGAQMPVIVVDRMARTPNGMTLLVELAEILQAPVVDQGGRMNFPNTHYLNQTGRRQALIAQADVLLGMELTDYWGVVNAFIDNGDDGGRARASPCSARHQATSISSVTS